MGYFMFSDQKGGEMGKASIASLRYINYGKKQRREGGGALVPYSPTPIYACDYKLCLVACFAIGTGNFCYEFQLDVLIL